MSEFLLDVLRIAIIPIAALIGVGGSLLGVLLGAWLTSWRERRRHLQMVDGLATLLYAEVTFLRDLIADAQPYSVPFPTPVYQSHAADLVRLFAAELVIHIVGFYISAGLYNRTLADIREAIAKKDIPQQRELTKQLPDLSRMCVEYADNVIARLLEMHGPATLKRSLDSSRHSTAVSR